MPAFTIPISSIEPCGCAHFQLDFDHVESSVLVADTKTGEDLTTCSLARARDQGHKALFLATTMRIKMGSAVWNWPSTRSSLSSTTTESEWEQRYKSKDMHYYRSLTPLRSVGHFQPDVRAIQRSLWPLDHIDYSLDDSDRPFFDQVSDFDDFTLSSRIITDGVPVYYDYPFLMPQSFYEKFEASKPFFSPEGGTKEFNRTLLDNESLPSFKRSLQPKGAFQLKEILQTKIRRWLDFDLQILNSQGIKPHDTSRVSILDHSCGDNETAFRRYPWRTLASTMCRKRKGSYGHLAHSKHKYWLEKDTDDHAYVPATRDRRFASRYSCHLKVQKDSVVDNEDLLRRLLALLRKNACVVKEGCASRFVIGSFVGQRVFRQVEQANIEGGVYLFEVRSHPGQQAHKALVFERSKVRGWNQRQRKRCTKLTYPDEVLLETVYSHDFQVLIFSGPWHTLLPPSPADWHEFPPLPLMRDGPLLKRDKHIADRTFTDTVLATGQNVTSTASAIGQESLEQAWKSEVPSPLGITAPQSMCRDRQRRKRHWIRLEDLEKINSSRSLVGRQSPLQAQI